MINDNSFANNNKFVESTIRLIREFYIRNSLIDYTYEFNSQFNYDDNIAAKSENLRINSRYANDPNNFYVYPVLQDYRFDAINATYNLTNLITDGESVIGPGEVSYSFGIYSINGDTLPENIVITIDETNTVLIRDKDYSYNNINGKITIFNAVSSFTLTA